MANILQNIRNMPNRNRAILLAVAVMGIAALVLVVSWTQRADYQVLYAGLAESDAGSIVQKLKELKVPYRLDAGSVLVPGDRVYDVRLQLAAQGLPHGGGVGFELFDKTDFSTTDFVQRLNYRRALQGELARTIMSLSEVEQCRVHLAMPEKSLFVEKEEHASASVLVKLRPGRTLSQGQVQGIVHLVSSSIEGLSPRDVTVIDSRGEMLTRPVDDIAGLSSSQLEYQRNYERDMESRVLGILEPIVGKGKARAKVTASLDFSKIEKTEERFDPDGQVVRSEQKNSERSTAGGQGGVPGVGSNLPGKSPAKAGGSQNQTQRQSETVNYEISRVTSRVVSATGELKKLSVAVIIDGIYSGKEGSKEKQYAPRTVEDMRHYEDLVKRAIGFSADRGDDVRVVNMQFESLPNEDLAGAPPRQYLPIVLTAARYLVPLAGLVLFFLFIVRPLIAVLSAPVPVGQGLKELPLPRSIAEIEKAFEAKGLSTQPDVIEWARKNPDQAASLVKRWVQER